MRWTTNERTTNGSMDLWELWGQGDDGKGGRRGHCIFAAPQVGMRLPTKNERHPSRSARARHIAEDGQMRHSFELTFLSSAETAKEENKTA